MTLLNIQDKVKDFSTLLDSIESLNDKRKQLWKEVYENALADRENAHAMFIVLVNITRNDSTEHAVHGKTMATYIEKMSRANDQLIKLAELIAKASDASEEIDPEEMFLKINNKSH